MLGEDRRRGFEHLAHKALGKPDTLAIHIGAASFHIFRALG
jgi:hypothetical protein